MTRHRHLTSRLLAGVSSPSIAVDAPPAVVPETVDSDFVVILAALLCALICVLGLVAVSRCACLRRISAAVTATQHGGAGNKGLKKKTIMSLPKRRYTEADKSKLTDCAICLSEFCTGDEIRALPQCGHGFHVSCIDTWLASHSTCPSCRQILAVERCHKCGGLPPSSAAASPAAAAGAAAEAAPCDSNDFLP